MPPTKKAGQPKVAVSSTKSEEKGREAKSTGRRSRQSGATPELPAVAAQTEGAAPPSGKVRKDVSVDRAKSEVKTVDPRNAMNELTSTEWLPETISVWTQRGLGANHTDAQIERQHPAPFSFTDVSRLVRFFTKRGNTVLDPFVGVGSTLKACAIEGRKGIGFELNPRYAQLATQRLKAEVRDLWAEQSQDVRVGDSRDLVLAVPDNSIDFVVTSPPYWNILHKEDHKVRQERTERELDTRYGDDPRDLGNVHDYDDFLRALSEILGACSRPLRPGKYMAVVVSDFRDKSRYMMFHSDLASALASYGLEMRGLTVLYQRHKRIFPYGYPYAYVPNIHHQFILILQNTKGKLARRTAKG